MKEYVIIGNGTAALGCIDGIRSEDKETPITVVSGEPYPAYCRPLISYVLEGKASADRLNARGADDYEKNGCRVLYGKKAVKIDPEKKTVTTDGGDILPYSALCVATGSSPFVPPFEGLDTVEKRFSFMTLDDMKALDAALSPQSRVLIIGAGLIGLKCAEGIAGRVEKITVCDLAPRILSSVLDEECAARMQAVLKAHGIRFLLGDTAVRFDKNTAVMKSGVNVDFDILVLAVGVRANTGLIRDAGGEVNRGILVDTGMRTSLPDVYAVGDCAEGYDASLGGRRVLAVLPNARLQGECAGRNMAGGSAVFDNAIPLNAVGFFGLHAMTAGTAFPAEDGGEVREEKTETTIRKFFTRNGLLTGFMLVGGPERAGIYTSLIRDRVPLDTVDTGLLFRAATNAAFGYEERRHRFGGVK